MLPFELLPYEVANSDTTCGETTMNMPLASFDTRKASEHVEGKFLRFFDHHRLQLTYSRWCSRNVLRGSGDA